jgi:hypothetical protein
LNFFDLNIGVKKLTVANVYNHICNKNQLKKIENACFEASVKNLCITIKDNEVFTNLSYFQTNIFACQHGIECGPIKINPKQ